jgi:ABC-type multidrug transport system ATPase subunit
VTLVSTERDGVNRHSSFYFDRLTVEGVSRHFGRRRALSKISFEARGGNVVGLLGPNGAGKSTMIAVLATLLRPTTGRLRYGTHVVDAGAGTGSASASLRAAIGVLGHDLFLYPELTARENLVFFGALHGDPDPEGAAARALEVAGLAARGNDPVASFSRGMRQRTALERALIHSPKLLLLDEPFTGLDDVSAAALLDRLRALRAAGAMILIATHDLDLAEGLLDQALFLRQGRVVEILDRPLQLRATYRTVLGGEVLGPRG